MDLGGRSEKEEVACLGRVEMMPLHDLFWWVGEGTIIFFWLFLCDFVTHLGFLNGLDIFPCIIRGVRSGKHLLGLLPTFLDSHGGKTEFAQWAKCWAGFA